MLIAIDRLIYDEAGARALITDINSECRYLIVRNGEGFSVCNESGELLAFFNNLPETVHSDFYSVCNLLQRMLEDGTKTYGESILNEMNLKNSETCVKDEEYNVRYRFVFRNTEYEACVIHDYSGDVPSFYYCVFVEGLAEPVEEYVFLSQAAVSEFYPVFAVMDEAVKAMLNDEEAE